MFNFLFSANNKSCFLKSFLSSVFILLLANCQSFEKKLSENNQLHPPIEDCVTILSQHYPPALNKIQIQEPDKPFGKALEEELRSKGYALVPKVKGEKKKDSVIIIDYLFDQMDPSIFKLRLSVADKFYTYRLYEMIDNQLQPIGPLSIEWKE